MSSTGNIEEEFIDVVGTDGRKTGIRKKRALIHRDGDLHQTVHVWISDGKRVLLQKRAPQKDSFPNKWDVSAAGHVSSGEDIEQAAMRECYEELGLKRQLDEFNFIGKSYQYHENDLIKDNELVYIYVIKKSISLKEVQIEEDEISGVLYINPGLLKKLVQNRDPRLVPHDEEYELLLNYLLKH